MKEARAQLLPLELDFLYGWNSKNQSHPNQGSPGGESSCNLAIKLCYFIPNCTIAAERYIDVNPLPVMLLQNRWCREYLYIQGVLYARGPGLGWLWFWCFTILYSCPAPSTNFPSGRIGQTVERSNFKSTQPSPRSRWDTLYNASFLVPGYNASNVILECQIIILNAIYWTRSSYSWLDS